MDHSARLQLQSYAKEQFTGTPEVRLVSAKTSALFSACINDCIK